MYTLDMNKGLLLSMMYTLDMNKGLTALYDVGISLLLGLVLLGGEGVLDVAVCLSPHGGLQGGQASHLLHPHHEHVLRQRLSHTHTQLHRHRLRVRTAAQEDGGHMIQS